MHVCLKALSHQMCRQKAKQKHTVNLNDTDQ